MEKKYYGTVLLIALVFGFLFELHLILLLVVVVVYLLCVPKLVRNQAQFRYETNRFHDVNLYMSQMLYLLFFQLPYLQVTFYHHYLGHLLYSLAPYILFFLIQTLD